MPLHKSFIREGSAPRSIPYPFVNHYLNRNVTPFLYLLLTNGNPFTYVVWNAVYLSNALNVKHAGSVLDFFTAIKGVCYRV